MNPALSVLTAGNDARTMNSLGHAYLKASITVTREPASTWYSDYPERPRHHGQRRKCPDYNQTPS